MPRWQTSKELQLAIRNTGIGGLKFTLTGGHVFDSNKCMVGIFLKPLSPLPQDRATQQAIGSALLTIFELTYFKVAESVPRISKVKHSTFPPHGMNPYYAPSHPNYIFAPSFSGVPVLKFEFTYNSAKFGRLHFGSFLPAPWHMDTDGNWEPRIVDLVSGYSVSAEEYPKELVKREVLSEILKACLPLKSVPLLLKG